MILAHYAAWMPYTVFIMMVGIMVDHLHRGTQNGLGVLSDSIEAWDHIDPHLLLFASIPPLLFGGKRLLSPRRSVQMLTLCVHHFNFDHFLNSEFR